MGQPLFGKEPYWFSNKRTGWFMMETDDLEHTLKEVLQEVKDTLNQLQLEQALSHAQQGQFELAEQTLSNLSAKNDNPIYLDLLARILARQAKWDQAEQVWERVLTIDPNHANAQAGLLLLRSQRSEPKSLSSLRSFSWILISLVALLFLAFLTVQSYMLNQRVTKLAVEIENINLITMREAEHTQVIENLSTVPTLPYDQLVTKEDWENLSSKLANWFEAARPISTKYPSILDQIWLDLPNAHITRSPNSIKIVFEQGLFLYEQKLSPEGAQILRELSYQLLPFSEMITIEVYGFTDDTESTNSFLDLQRAVTIVKYLAMTSQFPAAVFNVRSSEGIPSPYPNNNLANRMKNRTAILVIYEKTK